MSFTIHKATRRINGVETALYRKWRAMRTRCNPKWARGKCLKNYAERGIKICKRWASFQNFAADMGEPPTGSTLERNNNNGDYRPSNCRWATRHEQARNMRSSRIVTFQGKTQCAKDWSIETGIHYATLIHRLRHGWSVPRALTHKPKYTRKAA